MTPIRHAIDYYLRAHEPYPALAIDGTWNITAANSALATLTDGVAPALLEPPANALRICLHPDGMAPRIVNLGEWSTHILERLRNRIAATGNAAAQQLSDQLNAYPGVEADTRHTDAANDIVVPLRLRSAGGELEFLSTVSTFVTAADVTLAELSIEAFYPASTQTMNVLMRASGEPRDC